MVIKSEWLNSNTQILVEKFVNKNQDIKFFTDFSKTTNTDLVEYFKTWKSTIWLLKSDVHCDFF